MFGSPFRTQPQSHAMSTALDQLKPGQSVTLTVKQAPNNAAATKTLVRLLAKDPEVRRRDDKLARIRKQTQTKSPRGGRWRVWESRQPKIRTVEPAAGASATFVAGTAELRDLNSVAKYVDVA